MEAKCKLSELSFLIGFSPVFLLFTFCFFVIVCFYFNIILPCCRTALVDAAVFFLAMLCEGRVRRRLHHRSSQRPVVPSRSRCIGSWPSNPFSGSSANFEFSFFHVGILAIEFVALDRQVTSKNSSCEVDTQPWIWTAQSLDRSTYVPFSYLTH